MIRQVLHAENPSEAVVESISYPSPAFEGKLLLGDKLLRVNGSAMESLSRDQLEQVLRPVQATEIVLEVSRAGKQMTFHIFPVTYQEALAKIGRRLSRFGPTSSHCPSGNGF